MAIKKKSDKTINETLKKLSAIAAWFESQDEVDVEEGLEKVKEATVLIKAGRERLKEVKNEFKEIEKDLEEVIEDEEFSTPSA